MSINKAILTGRVGRDPEMRTTESGKDVCTFSLATSEYYNKQENTTWHNCVAWGATAKFIHEYFKKGSGMELEGRISNRSYEKDGQTKWVSEIIVAQVSFPVGGGKKEADATEQQAPPDTGGDDDLPF